MFAVLSAAEGNVAKELKNPNAAAAPIRSHHPYPPCRSTPPRGRRGPCVTPPRRTRRRRSASRATRHRRRRFGERESGERDPRRRLRDGLASVRVVSSRRFASGLHVDVAHDAPQPDRPERQQVPEEEHRRPHEERGGGEKLERTKNHVSLSEIKINSRSFGNSETGGTTRRRPGAAATRPWTPATSARPRWRRRTPRPGGSWTRRTRRRRAKKPPAPLAKTPAPTAATGASAREARTSRRSRRGADAAATRAPGTARRRRGERARGRGRTRASVGGFHRGGGGGVPVGVSQRTGALAVAAAAARSSARGGARGLRQVRRARIAQRHVHHHGRLARRVVAVHLRTARRGKDGRGVGPASPPPGPVRGDDVAEALPRLSPVTVARVCCRSSDSSAMVRWRTDGVGVRGAGAPSPAVVDMPRARRGGGGRFVDTPWTFRDSLVAPRFSRMCRK